MAMMGWYGDGPGWAGWVVMTLMMLAFWGLLVLGGIVLYRSLNRDERRADAPGADAEQLLDERFARGEIDAEDYRQRRELLRAGR
jgi:putative membrane protein